MGSIYGLFDQVLVGFMTSSVSLALYSRSRQIGKLAVQVTSAISMVMMPRLASVYQVSHQDYLKLKYKAYHVVIMLAIPIMVGVFILSKEIMFILGGVEFEQGYLGLQIVSIWTFVVTISIFTDNQVFIPTNNERYTTLACTVVGALSIILNVLLIPRWDFIGAALSLLVAETAGMLIQVWFAAKKLKFTAVYLGQLRFVFAALAMSVAISIIKYYIDSVILEVFLSVVFGAGIYFLVLVVIRDQIVLQQFRWLYEKLAK